MYVYVLVGWKSFLLRWILVHWALPWIYYGSTNDRNEKLIWCNFFPQSNITQHTHNTIQNVACEKWHCEVVDDRNPAMSLWSKWKSSRHLCLKHNIKVVYHYTKQGMEHLLFYTYRQMLIVSTKSWIKRRLHVHLRRRAHYTTKGHQQYYLRKSDFRKPIALEEYEE